MAFIIIFFLPFQEERMLKTYFSRDIISIETMKECEWELFKKTHALEMESFYLTTGLLKNRPLNRLIPRLTVRGGFVETFRLKFSLEENPDWNIFFLDVNSLYSRIALDNEFGIGPYTIIIDPKELNLIKFTNGEFLYRGESMKADSCHVTFLAPENLLKPFLPFRFNNEFNFYSLCRTCVLQKNTFTCPHKKPEVRAFTSCYMMSEVSFAVKNLGYKVLHFHEVHHFSAHSPFLKDYVKILAAEKLKNSNILNGIPPSQQKEFCENLNESMNLESHCKLSPNNICDNPFQKQFYKTVQNCFFGRFALRNNFNKHIFCKSIREIENFSNKPNTELVDLFPLSDDVCEIEVSSTQKCTPNLKGNLYVTSSINALAREFIYDKIMKVEQSGGIVLSCDVDSITFALKKGTSNPLKISPQIGDFKEVLSNCKLISYCSLSPRNYSILYQNEKNEICQLLKVKGLSLTSHNCDKLISHKVYSDFVDQNFVDNIKNFYVPQMKKKFDKATKSHTDILCKFNFTSETHVKRFILKNSSSFETLPYGYKFNYKTPSNNKQM